MPLSIYIYNEVSQTALHIATLKNNSWMINHLLEAQADVNAVDRNGLTLLMMAVNERQSGGIHLPIRYNVLFYISNKAGHTALHQAAFDNNVPVLKQLLEAHCDVNTVDNKGWTPLMVSAQGGREDIAQLLIQHGALANIYNGIGQTALHIATSNNQSLVIKCLVEAHADVNVIDNQGWTPLMIAAQEGYQDIANLLIKLGANVDTSSEIGWTALHIAAFYNSSPVAKCLLMAHADIDAVDTYGTTPLMLSASEGHEDIADLLIQHNALIDISNGIGLGAFHIAVLSKTPAIKIMLEAEADVNDADEYGSTPLMVAAQEGHMDVADLLIQHNALLDISKKIGRTAVHGAAFNNNGSVLNIRVDAQCDVNVVDNRGWIPLMPAAQERHNGVANLLIHYNARVVLSNGIGRIALHIAVFNFNQSLIKCLLEAHTGANTVDEEGLTPLMYSAWGG